jgi:hypothetical protein
MTDSEKQNKQQANLKSLEMDLPVKRIKNSFIFHILPPESKKPLFFTEGAKPVDKI